MSSPPAARRPRARPGRPERARTRVSRYLDRPFASAQLLLLVGAGLLVFGILMSVSTTIAAASDGQGSIWSQVVKEGIFIAVGLPLFWLAMLLSPRAYRFLAYPAAFVGVFVLVIVLIPGIGVGVYGARRWIDIGPMQLQPSEIAKLGFLLWGAYLLSRRQEMKRLGRPRDLFWPLLPGFVLFAGLVMLEPDLGTTLCFLLILLGLLWMVGMPMRYFGAVLTVLIAGVFALAYAAPYRWQRMTTFLDPFKHKQTSGFHTVEGLYALASGGIFGVGLGQGTSKYGWVPNANSDYVFAIIGEELGLLGCLVVLALFALLGFTGMRIAARNADPFVRITAGAATVWLCGQAIINVGYVTGLLPVTGIPLPLISAGGTSLVASLVVLGMMTSFALNETDAIAAARAAADRAERSLLVRLLRIPVPRGYVARGARRAKRASSGRGGRTARRAEARSSAARATAPPSSGARATAPRSTGARSRTAQARARADLAARPRRSERALPPTGTDGRRRRR